MYGCCREHGRVDLELVSATRASNEVGSWIVIRLTHTLSDGLLRIPFYYELKLLFVLWLVLPKTRVSAM